MNWVKKIAWVLLVILLGMQAFRPAKNETAIIDKDISTLYPVPQPIEQILVKACYDCHSNKSVYPWYSNIQPIAWWLNNHIEEGKREFNFNEFAGYRLAKQYHKLEEIIDEVKGNEMPLSSYTLVHKNAILSAKEKEELIQWTASIRDTMRAHYPVDSLVRKKK